MINYERIVLTIKQDRKTMKKKKRKKAESFLEIETVYLSHDKSIDRISGYEYPALITRH